MIAAIDMVIAPRDRSIGSMDVRRVLPYRAKRSVGPFVFLDEMGPVAMAPGITHDVLPHPHIGLATITYLLDGVLRHRDSLGTVQDIRPHDVNWMTAGRGIVHSERTPPDLIDTPRRLHGMQAWVALPQAHEAGDPSFQHHPQDTLPTFEVGSARLTLILGTAFGRTSPVKLASRTVYLDVQLLAGGEFVFPTEGQETALYLFQGEAVVDGQAFQAPQLIVFKLDSTPVITAGTDVRGVLLGGEPLAEPRHMWWNFVSSSPDLIEQAKQDWQNRRFPAIPGETESIPLPAT